MNYSSLNSEVRPSASPSTMPDHLNVAMGFANEILDRFDRHLYAEMLALIKERWAQGILEMISMNESEIDATQKRISVLKDTLNKM